MMALCLQGLMVVGVAICCLLFTAFVVTFVRALEDANKE